MVNQTRKINSNWEKKEFFVHELSLDDRNPRFPDTLVRPSQEELIKDLVEKEK